MDDEEFGSNIDKDPAISIKENDTSQIPSELNSNNEKGPVNGIKENDISQMTSSSNINQNEILPTIIQNESLNKNEIKNLNSDISNDNQNKINKLQSINNENEVNLSQNMKDVENNNYKTKIGIKSKKLKKLRKDYLLDLIHFINNSCSLTLNKNKDIDSSFSIFKIIKKSNKNCCEIIINQDKNNNINNFDENDEEENKSKIDDNKNIFTEKIKNNNNKNFEDQKLDGSNKKIHNLNFPIICSLHNNLKSQVLSDYLKHIKEEHDTFNCIECGKEFETFNQLKKHLYKMTFVFNNDEPKEKKNVNMSVPPFISNNKIKKKNSETKSIKCTECELIFDNAKNMNIHLNEIHKINKTELQKQKDKKINKKEFIFEEFSNLIEKRLNEEENKNMNEIIEDNIINIEEKDYPIKKQKQKDKNERKAQKKLKKENEKELNNVIQNILDSNTLPKKDNKSQKNKNDKELSNAIKDILDSNTIPKKGNKSQKNKNKDKDKDKDNIFNEKNPKKEDENKEIIDLNEFTTLSCNICQRDFFSKQALDKHQRDANHFDNSYNNLGDKEDSLICTFCGKCFSTQQAKESHCNAKNHHEELWCKICNKSFNSKISMDQHCKVKNHYIQLYCEICRKLFSTAQAKEQHCKVKMHPGY